MAAVPAEELRVSDAEEVAQLFWERGWTDGLPVVPPTRELVDEFLVHAGVPATPS